MIIITQTPPGSVNSPLNFSFKAPEGTPTSPIMGTGLFYNGTTMYPAMVIYNPLEFPNVYVQVDNAITTFTSGNVWNKDFVWWDINFLTNNKLTNFVMRPHVNNFPKNVTING